MVERRTDMLEVNEAQNGSEIALRIGESVILRLFENPTTGYRWHLCSFERPMLELQQESFEAARETIGAGGTRCWLLRAAEAGATPLVVERRRGRERTAVDTYRVLVNVEGPRTG
jgi:inhibitor of cysteine peptidase